MGSGVFLKFKCYKSKIAKYHSSMWKPQDMFPSLNGKKYSLYIRRIQSTCGRLYSSSLSSYETVIFNVAKKVPTKFI